MSARRFFCLCTLLLLVFPCRGFAQSGRDYIYIVGSSTVYPFATVVAERFGMIRRIDRWVLEHAIAAPLCTRQLAELGARVIKIERRQGGDFARYYDKRVRGLSSPAFLARSSA